MGKQLHGLLAGRSVSSPGEIGTLAYYCQCDIRDYFSDRTLLIPLIGRLELQHSPLVRSMMELNFAHLDRGQKSSAPTAHLVYRAGPEAPGRWPVDSAWRGHGAFDLLPR
jgi:hypothetical protein